MIVAADHGAGSGGGRKSASDSGYDSGAVGGPLSQTVTAVSGCSSDHESPSDFWSERRAVLVGVSTCASEETVYPV